MVKQYIRIHGDNIVECERTLLLLSQAFDKKVKLNSDSLYMPTYEMAINDNDVLQIELLSGHGRWGVDITTELIRNGGVLREGADSYITEVIDGNEQILLAIEYCSALPAGNNAWQRNGRAYSSILAGIPYLYFAEIGGVELDKNRKVKAPRFPNPIVPFSYIAATKRMSKFCLPVYKAHPSITKVLNNKFKSIFGYEESLQIIRGTLTNSDCSKAIETLTQKALDLVTLLANERKSIDTLRNGEWGDFLNSHHSSEWLSKNSKELIWKKKAANKVAISFTFKKLLAEVMLFKCLTIGAKDLPICIIPTAKRKDFNLLLKELYPAMNFSFDSEKQLAIVWITGFKPQGDDSRPDRGLTPLARMVLGNDTDILAIVYGPAKDSTWKAFKKSTTQIATNNGLWQSILKICDYVLIDSVTCEEKIFFKTNTKRLENSESVKFAHQKPIIEYSEHDTDTAIHQIFTHKERMGVFECLCNPPGGDWSGIIFFSNGTNEHRWTSLPRVSLIGGKRPDHIIQIMSEQENIFLSIESKRIGKDLEKSIGTKLKNYIEDLFKSQPTAQKTGKTNWQFFDNEPLQIKNFSILSIGAFIFQNEAELYTHLERGELDAIFAFEFGHETILHILTNAYSKIILDVLEQISLNMKGFKIQVY